VTVLPDDVISAGDWCRDALGAALDQDWDVPAGDLDWSCARTVEHIANANLRYALHFASRATGPLPRVRQHDEKLTRDDLLALVGAAAATLAETTRDAPGDARGFHPAGMADAEGFLAMGCDEVLVHTYDVATGLGRAFDPPADLSRRVVERLFPWAPIDAEPWATLLWANGRSALGEAGRLDADWSWHCAPLIEWDGSANRRTRQG
jgi:hypothetical protein